MSSMSVIFFGWTYIICFSCTFDAICIMLCVKGCRCPHCQCKPSLFVCISVRIFCLGLRSLANSVLVFGSDKAYTRGKKYTIDWHQAWVGVELDMEETSAQLVDLRPVEELPDCVVGLAADQRVLVWWVPALLCQLVLPSWSVSVPL